ncbi:MAG: adenylate/guanylate cyclase domain-containing protein [Herminiimonas sp.]|nr:adenylate/guanylate cyclase domain-containing protein [Herminiimonas sp.]
MTSHKILRNWFSQAAVIRLTIGALAILLSVWLQSLAPGKAAWFANEWLRDRFIAMQATAEPEQRMLVVDIDEASLAAIGPWPWPRARIADLVENLIDTYAARGIALDLVLPEPADAGGDARLSMLAQHAPVVLATAFDYDGNRTVPLRVGTLAGGTTPPAAGAVVATGGFIGNHAGLAATTVGNIGFIPDGDGVIRRLPLQTRFDGRTYPTLSLALLDCCGSQSRAAAPPAGASAGLWRIPFSRAWNAYAVVSAADILHRALLPEQLHGRLVLIGSSSLGLADRVATPLAASTSGLLVHAAALTTMLDAQAGAAPAVWRGSAIAVGFTMLLVALAGYTFPRLSAVSNVGILGAASGAWLAIAYFVSRHDPSMMSTGPLLSILFLLAVAVPFDWQVTQVKSRRLLGTLNQYVAKSVVTELLRSNLKDPLAPVQRTVTTLIADMEGYTTQVGALPVEAAARLTREFLDCLTRPVLASSGTLDKYTGDGLVAFWGAPLPDPDHADLALDAALAIVLEVRRYSRLRERMGQPRLRVRIGIESGVAMAGDFGTAFRSIYTAVGDSVNVASRLEQMARDFPHDVIVGPGTAAAARRHVLLPLGSTVVRGKDAPIELFALGVPQ